MRMRLHSSVLFNSFLLSMGSLNSGYKVLEITLVTWKSGTKKPLQVLIGEYCRMFPFHTIHELAAAVCGLDP
jgi:hypothetical protein